MSENTTEATAETAARTIRKVREGLVVSDRMDKTVVVSVEDRVKHALYGKVLRRSTRLKAHDEALERLAEATGGLGAGAHVCCLLGHASALLSSAVSTVPMPSSRSRMTV